MSIYATIISLIAGICLGYALLYLFVGLRRGQDKRLNLLFALFALGYAGTLLMGIVYRSQATVEAFLAISRWDGIFIWLAFVALNWYVAEYAAVRAKWYLWGITFLFTVSIVAAILTPTLTFSEMPMMVDIPLPWDETVSTLSGKENIWGALLLLAQLITLGFIVFVGVRQLWRGERQAALVLLGGMAWFIIALLYEILAEVGLWEIIPLAETGFLGIAVALSLQMANSVIKTEEALARHQDELETLVGERTKDLQQANALLLEQERSAAAVEERSRLARDLHDSVTQTLYSVSLVAAALPRVLERSPEEAKRSILHLRNMTLGALAEMRTLLFELRPDALKAAKLGTLLQHAADVFTGRTHVPVEMTIVGTPDLPHDTKLAFYRITQEAFNNIAKYAEATQVSVALQDASDVLTLRIADNGRGFEPQVEPATGLGLKIMDERAEQIGARLDIDSAPGRGTMLAVQWPEGRSDA